MDGFNPTGGTNQRTPAPQAAPPGLQTTPSTAVARAFRFATNVSMKAFEELGRNGTGNGTVGASAVSNGSKKTRMTQERYIRTLCD